LTEDQYHELCDACDTVLLDEDSSIERVSISWLHVIREHPDFLKNYESLFLNKIYTRVIKHISEFIVSKLKNIYHFRWYFIQRPSFWDSSNKELEELDILFISHFLNKSQAGKSSDPYFNNIVNRLENMGYSVGIVLINHTDLKSAEVIEKWENCTTPRIVLSPILPFSEELSVRKKLKKESIILARKSKNQSSPFLKRVLNKASQEAISNNTLRTYRMFKQFDSLFNKVNPKVVVSTYEGHAYERVIYHTAKHFNKKISCIAYQHAAVFRLQHAIKRRLKNYYNPDFILTSGVISKQKIDKQSNFENTMISILGTDRGVVGHDFLKNNIKEYICCMVLPEGSLNECKILFEFSYHCAIDNPSVIFVWRLHPIINFSTLKCKIPVFNDLPKNIILSNKSLEEDLLNADFAIYRGTTAIIKAISHRIRPLYFSIAGELNIDILFETNYWKKTISKVEDFRKIVTEPFDQDDEEFELLINYCNNLFCEFDFGMLDQIINDSVNNSDRDSASY
jgi:hypothetical protein